MRNALLPAGEREENLACDLNDTSWFSRIDASDGAIFFAAGVFYYFLTEQVRTLEKTRLTRYLGTVTAQAMKRIDRALGMSIGST